MTKFRIITITLILTLWITNAAPAAIADPYFGKIAPVNNAIDVPAGSVTLSWQPIQDYTGTGTVTYRYCLQTKPKCTGGKWIKVGQATSVTLQNLLPNTTYYWWVRAYVKKNSVIAEADGGYWSFTTLGLPGAFYKTNPAPNSQNQPLDGVRLWWTDSANPAPNAPLHYEYCLDTEDNGSCDTGWVEAESGVTLSGLRANTTYYWQVRAVNGSGVTLAGDGWWPFSMVIEPVAFQKISPAQDATRQRVNALGLSWTASEGASAYQYCISTIYNACSGSWIDAGSATSAIVSGLNYNTDYYWQVLAFYAGNPNPVSADEGLWWKFHTESPLPSDFTKLLPPDLSTNLPTEVTFTWQTSPNASYYEFCLFTGSIDTTCEDTPWIRVSETTYTLPGLDTNTPYYWQVRAVNESGIVEANGIDAWWSFVTRPDPPGEFNKIAPADAAFVTATNPILTWSPAAPASVTYQVCYDTTDNDVCDEDAWQPVGTNTSYGLSNLKNSTTYYWQVRASNAGGTTYANGDPAAWFRFSTPNRLYLPAILGE